MSHRTVRVSFSPEKNCSIHSNSPNLKQLVQQSLQMITTVGTESSSLMCHNRKPPVVVFAHGASMSSSHDWMTRWKNLLANALNAAEVVTFDYPYINGKRKAAPQPEQLVGFHSDIVRTVAAKYPDHPLILAGKAMGSKISCMVAAENGIEASAVVCLGYPLKATNKAIRDEPLLRLTVPIMFVQGGNDIFCPLNSLQAVRYKLKAFNDLHVIEYGDHSFQIAKKYSELTGMTREQAEECAAEAVAAFVSRITSVPLGSCLNNILSQPVLKMDARVEDDVGEQNNETVKSQPKVEKISSVTQKPPTRNIRKRKSERIVKNKLKKTVYVKDGRGMTVDNPLNID